MKTHNTTRDGLGWLIKMALLAGMAAPQWSAAQDDAWNQMQNVPGAPRQQAVAFTISGNGYVATGTDPGVRGDLVAYNFATGLWTRKTATVGPRFGAVGFSIRGKGYVALGQDGFQTFNDLQEYDVERDAFTRRAAFPGRARIGAVAFSIGSKGYVCTGAVGRYCSRELWEYDPRINLWKRRADFPANGRTGGVAFTVGGKAYVGLGTTDGHALNDLWEYDPKVNRWKQKAALDEVGRYSATAFAYGYKGFVAGGHTQDGFILNDCWMYDPAQDAWTRKADMPIGRMAAVGFASLERGYVATGFDGRSSKRDLLEYKNASVLQRSTELPPTFPEELASITAYPNPARDDLNITWPAGLSGPAFLELFEVTGKLVLSTRANVGTPFVLDLRGQREGVYMLRITAPGIGTRTLRVQRTD
jgi:N-acetylneuraminic acid mutarotase